MSEKFKAFKESVQENFKNDVEATYELVFEFISSLPKECYNESIRFELTLYKEGCSLFCKNSKVYFLDNLSGSYCFSVVSEVLKRLDEEADENIEITDHCGSFTILLHPLIP